MGNLSISQLDSDTWANRLLSLFPAKWSASAARQSGGVLWAVFKSFGLNLEITNENLIYTWYATRIMLATDAALDTVAQDFFGAAYGYAQFVYRAEGESDSSFRTRILANLLLPGATRKALIEMVTFWSGAVPRVIEPWRLQDTGAWDCNSFFDVDTPECPARYANPALQYQGAVITQLPTIPGSKPFPMMAFDAGSGWDSAYFVDTASEWLLTAARMDELINRIKTFGTTVWRQYNPPLVGTKPVASSYAIPAGAQQRQVAIFPPLYGPYAVMAQCDWNSSIYWVPANGGSFQFKFGVPAPTGGGNIDWIAAPLLVPGFGQIPIAPNSRTPVTLSRPASLPTHQLFVSPSWNTTSWITSLSDSGGTVNWGTESPISGRLSYAWLPQSLTGYATVQPGSLQIVIPIPVTVKRYIALISPGWNTSFEIAKYPTHCDVTVAVEPDGAYPLYWAIYPY